MTIFAETLRVPIFWLTLCIIRQLESKFGYFEQNLLCGTIFFSMDPKMSPKSHEKAFIGTISLVWTQKWAQNPIKYIFVIFWAHFLVHTQKMVPINAFS